jgi:hypothetical protein
LQNAYSLKVVLHILHHPDTTAAEITNSNLHRTIDAGDNLYCHHFTDTALTHVVKKACSL